MKHFLILIIFLLGIQLVKGQNRVDKKETVYLQDGSVLKGMIIEDNEYFIRIIIETGDTLQVGYKNILDPTQIRISKTAKKPRHYIEDGVFYNIGLRGELRDNFLGALNGRVGKRINQKWNVGLEGGFLSREENLGFNILDITYAHLNPYARYYLNSGRPRFFVYASGGYSFAIDTSNDGSSAFASEDHDGGIIAFAGAGLHFAGRKKVRWMIEIGSSFHRVEGNLRVLDPWVGNVDTFYSREYFSPSVGVSIEF